MSYSHFPEVQTDNAEQDAENEIYPEDDDSEVIEGPSQFTSVILYEDDLEPEDQDLEQDIFKKSSGLTQVHLY